MTFSALRTELQADLVIFENLYRHVGEEQMRWKPDPDRWSLLEVLNHLLDEEKADFRQALRNILEDPKIEWPKISPMQWVTERDYNSKDPIETMASFKAERTESLDWLSRTPEPSLETAHEGTHPFQSPLKIGDIIISWVAHDYFHIRQIINLKWEYLPVASEPYTCWYAGEY